MTNTSIEVNRVPFTWSVVIAGALAAWAVSFIFISLGTGVGLAVRSPYSGPAATTMTIGGAIWLIIAQSFGYATGGYLAGRLRIRDHIPGPETMFRDGAHGFMVWVVGVGVMAIVIAIVGAFAQPAAATAGPTPLSDAARTAAAYLSFWSFMALLFGAVAATLAGMLGGELRDEDPEISRSGRRKSAARAQ
jgi:hypothetical protein